MEVFVKKTTQLILLAFLIVAGVARVASAQNGYAIVVTTEPEMKMGSQSPTPGGLYRAIVPLANYRGTPTVQVRQGAGPWVSQQTVAYTSPSNSVTFYMAKTWVTGMATQVRVVVSNGNITQSYQFMAGKNDPSIYACSVSGTLNPRMYDGILGLPFTGSEKLIGRCASPSTAIVRGTHVIIRGGGFGKDVSQGYGQPPVVTATVNGVSLPLMNWEENATSHRWNLLFYIPPTVSAGSQQVVLTINGRTSFFLTTFQ